MSRQTRHSPAVVCFQEGGSSLYLAAYIDDDDDNKSLFNQ
jgi:hypothetical protein